ncbi:MAG: hypothetical protein JNM21_14925 [Taibaiella sp.]|nr:hypothetical protein [Taibaiella sp.]
MARIIIDNNLVIRYDGAVESKYWSLLSGYLKTKYGDKEFQNKDDVQEILKDGFDYLIETFQQLISAENSFTFFLYVYYLHQESLQIWEKSMSGLKLTKINETDFALYRRILKLVLEQGCDQDLLWGKVPQTAKEVNRIERIVQELIYLGECLYMFAEHIAYQSMVEECQQISFDREGNLLIDWRHHYGKAYEQLSPSLAEQYEGATFDQNAVQEFKLKIEECFKIKYDEAFGLIFQVQKHHNPNNPQFQTIEPYVLPLNLEASFNTSIELATIFYEGLSISKDNKLSLKDAILKPHSTQRYMFRPILIYNVGGEKRALVSQEKVGESILVLGTNAMHWNNLLEEWLSLPCMKSFIDKKGLEHDKILESEIEEIVKSKGLLYKRNVTTFSQGKGKDNINIDNDIAGEIDLIVIDENRKLIYVADVKYNRARYEAVGYRMDYSQFINPLKPKKSYETKLSKKVNWISHNLKVVEKDFRLIYNREDILLDDYMVEGIFIINTPTFYMFNGNFKTLTLKRLNDFFDGTEQFPTLVMKYQDGAEEKDVLINHPYFRKP